MYLFYKFIMFYIGTILSSSNSPIFIYFYYYYYFITNFNPIFDLILLFIFVFFLAVYKSVILVFIVYV